MGKATPGPDHTQTHGSFRMAALSTNQRAECQPANLYTWGLGEPEAGSPRSVRDVDCK